MNDLEQFKEKASNILHTLLWRYDIVDHYGHCNYSKLESEFKKELDNLK